MDKETMLKTKTAEKNTLNINMEADESTVLLEIEEHSGIAANHCWQ